MIKIDNFPEKDDQQEQLNNARDEREPIENINQDNDPDMADDENPQKPVLDEEIEDTSTEPQQVSAEEFQYENQKGIVEALIFASTDPITLNQLAKSAKLTKASVEDIVSELNKDYIDTGRSFRIEHIAGGYRMFTLPEYHSYINQAGIIERTQKLSQAALESLAVIAYKQPITRAEIERLRGVDCGGVLKNLMAKDLIIIDGRSDAPGKPILYRTSEHFLEFFGLPSLDHLPPLSEIADNSEIPKLTLTKEGENSEDNESINIFGTDIGNRLSEMEESASETGDSPVYQEVNSEDESAS